MAVNNPIQTTGQVLVNDMNEEFKLINPNYHPLVSWLRARGKRRSCVSTTAEWFSQSPRPMADELAADMTDVATTMVVTDDLFGFVDQLIRIGDEIVLVTAVSEDNLTLTITRAQNGTTATAHTTGDLVEMLALDVGEADGAIEGNQTVKERYTNYTQIFMETYGLTRTAQSVYAHGNGGMNQLSVEEELATRNLMKQMETSYMKGIKKKVSKLKNGKNQEFRNCDGLETMIETNGIVNVVGGALTFEAIEDLANDIFEAGGAAGLAAGMYYILAPTNQVRRLNALNQNIVDGSGNALNRVTRMDKDPVLGTNILQVQTSVGVLNVMPMSTMSKTKLIVADLEELMEVELRPYSNTKQGEAGLQDKYMLEGESTLEVGALKIQGIMTGLTV